MDDQEDLEYHEYRVNFIKVRIIQLSKEKDDLADKMLDKYTKTDRYDLEQLNKQIMYNQTLLLAMDDGQEYFQLEN